MAHGTSKPREIRKERQKELDGEKTFGGLQVTLQMTSKSRRAEEDRDGKEDGRWKRQEDEQYETAAVYR